MRFPSMRMVASEARRSLARFPGVLAMAAVAAVAGVALVERQGDDAERLVRWLVAASLGLPLVFALTLAAERSARRVDRALPVLALPVLAGIFFAWPSWSDPVAGRRYVQLSLAFHLLAAWLPFAGARGTNAFWQCNRRLFLRFLLGAVYTLILFLGVSGALAALDQLFGLDVDGDLYAELFIVLGFIFHTWFFVGGVPRLDTLEGDHTYPTALKVLSQFILLPIVVLYLTILTVYLGKVAVTQVWPSGWIGYLVTSVAAVGVLSLLLVHPIREREENRWVATYARWFYVVLLPSIAMLVLAVYKRIDQYGVTENRYFLLVLSAWLAYVAVTFIVRRSASIMRIPISLMALAILTCFGPWGAYAVSTRSQLGRLEGLLERSALVEDGVVRRATEPIDAGDVQEISRVLDYLVATHGADAVERRFTWPEGDVDAPSDDEPLTVAAREARALMARAGLDYTPAWERGPSTFAFEASVPLQPIDVAGWPLVFRIDRVPRTIAVGERTLTLTLDPTVQEVRLAATDGVEVRFDLASMQAEVTRRRLAGDARLRWSGSAVVLDGQSTAADAASGIARARLVVHAFDGLMDDEAPKVHTVTATLLLAPAP